VVTGTPGVGKTIVSERLAGKLGAVHIDVADMIRREEIASGYDEKRQTLIADDEKLAKRVQQIIAKTSKTVIVDGHFATEVAPKDYVTKVILLRCHPKQLEQRMVEKGFQGAKLRENLAAEILDVCLTDAVNAIGVEKVCEVNTTGKTVDDTVKEIVSILRKAKRCTVGVVDWLGQLEVEGSLDQYLHEF